MKHIRENYSWIIDGLEVFLVGWLFLTTDHFIDKFEHTPVFITYFDDPPFSIALILIGTYIILSCFGYLTNSKKEIIVFLLSFIWTFYFIIFLIHDLSAPVFVPRFDTTIAMCLVIRTFCDSHWGRS